MATDLYKKSYEGDYSKSYKNYISWRRESESRKREYNAISKKLNDTPYNKKERSEQYDIVGTRPKESERVYADGSHNSRDRGQIKRNWNDESAYAPQKQETRQTTKSQVTPVEVVPEIKIVEERETQTYIPPIFQEVKEKPKPWKNAYEEEEIEVEEDDGNYNYFDYPIEEIGFEQYRNLKTNKRLDVEGAREVLRMAGYEAKPNNNIGAIFFIFIAANVAVPFLAPIIAIGYGLFRMKMKTTAWLRGAGKQTYKYSLPATDSEIAGSQIVGKIAIGVGVIAAFIRYADML